MQNDNNQDENGFKSQIRKYEENDIIFRIQNSGPMFEIHLF